MTALVRIEWPLDIWTVSIYEGINLMSAQFVTRYLLTITDHFTDLINLTSVDLAWIPAISDSTNSCWSVAIVVFPYTIKRCIFTHLNIMRTTLKHRYKIHVSTDWLGAEWSSIIQIKPVFLYFFINLKNIKLICEYLTSYFFFITYIYVKYFLIFFI